MHNENIIKKKNAIRILWEVRILRAATYDDVVNNVKLIMNEKGMKQKVVAERAGFSDAEFSNMLNERRKLIRIEHIPKIAKALGVEPNELYGIATKQKEVV